MPNAVRLAPIGDISAEAVSRVLARVNGPASRDKLRAGKAEAPKGPAAKKAT